MSAYDPSAGLLLTLVGLTWLAAYYLPHAARRLGWEPHVEQAIALTRPEIPADFTMPRLFTDADAGELLAEECAEYRRTNGGAA